MPRSMNRMAKALLPSTRLRSATTETIFAVRDWVSRPARICWLVGTTLLKLAATVSALIVAHHFGVRLPGCGPMAGCAELQRSEWGVVPWVHWPIAFLGIAYFAGMMGAFALSHRGITPALRALAWLGALFSLLLTGVMIYLHEFCLYCALTHALNLAFVGFMEAFLRLDRRAQPPGATRMNFPRGRMVRTIGLLGRIPPLGAFVGVFAITTGVLAVLNSSNIKKQAVADEADRADSTQRIIEKSALPESEQPADRWGVGGFTGRYRKGPEQAAIRIVVLTDYQCPDCKRVESEIEQIMKERSDVSLSVKHFPMCTDCNKHAGRTIHANACWAARAAEAAGILGGDEAFFKMHQWLFEKKGTFFKTEDLEPIARSAGLDLTTLGTVMQGPEPLKRVQGDIEDGMALGLYSTPMVFVNGVEFKGWQVAGALPRSVAQVAATNPPARSAAADRPVLAAQRYIDDWQESPPLPHPPDTHAWPLGLKPDQRPAGGLPVVDIVVFGDYQEANTIEVDKQIREAMKGRTNVRYTFRHYPVDTTCNPTLPPDVPAGSIHPLACLASKAAEAAGLLGGNDAYWKMHQWLMENAKTLSPESVRSAAKGFGWDVDRFAALMDTPNVTDAITEDCHGARVLGLTSIPYVIVNDRLVPRALRENDNVIKRIVDLVSKKKPGAQGSR